MYIRWLGAFNAHGHQYTLLDSLRFEFTRTTPVACESIGREKLSSINHAKVGLLLDSKAVYRRFESDCWSVYTDDGNLKNTRVLPKYLKGQHTEAWATPGPGYIKGIVTKRPWWNLQGKNRKAIRTFAAEKGLPVYFLNAAGQLERIQL